MSPQARYVRAQLDAGADHVALSVVSAGDQPQPEEWQALAGALGLAG